MTIGVVKYSEAGAANQPSPSIWRDCRGNMLNDLGLGYHVFENFMGARTSANAEAGVAGSFQVDGDTATVISPILPVDQHGGRIDLETDGDDNDAVILFQQIGIGLVIDSGNKVWFEARVALGAAADQGFVVGLAEEDGLDVDIVVDNGASIGAESAFYFAQFSNDTGALDAEFNLNTGTGTTVLADVTRAAVYTGASGNAAADFPVADIYHKFGLRFDGKSTLEYYLDGYKIADLALVAATHPDNVEMGPFVALKTGSAAVVSMNIEWVRYAYQERT